MNESFKENAILKHTAYRLQLLYHSPEEDLESKISHGFGSGLRHGHSMSCLMHFQYPKKRYKTRNGPSNWFVMKVGILKIFPINFTYWLSFSGIVSNYDLIKTICFISFFGTFSWPPCKCIDLHGEKKPLHIYWKNHIYRYLSHRKNIKFIFNDYGILVTVIDW